MAKKTKTTKKPAKKLNELDETGRRSADRRQDEEKPVSEDRRKGHRRRQIDPTTCERDYSEKEIEFMNAMDEYKRLSGRMFPTCSEILEVILKLGYRQIADIQDVYAPETGSTNQEADSESLEEIA